MVGTKSERIVTSGRIRKLRDGLLGMPSVCIERGYWMTESFKETGGEPFVIRRAKALQKILHNMSISIRDGDLFAGRPTSKLRAGYIQPEIQWSWYLEEMDTLPTRGWDKFSSLTQAEKSRMKEFLPYWKGIALQDKWRAMMPPDKLKLVNIIQSGVAYANNNQYYGHVSADYPRLLAEGLSGIKKQVDAEIAGLNLSAIDDFNKYLFLKAVNITFAAAIDFAGRYAALARQMAAVETDPVRKKELEKMAATCERVPAKPARTLYEALQSVWFIYVVALIEAWGAGASFGRTDQFLLPFYRKDIAEGRLTEDSARELLALFLIKMNEFAALRPEMGARVYSGTHTGAKLTLGGITPEGKDAVNELSYLFLEAEEQVGLMQEDLIIRVHPLNPDSFLTKACEVNRNLKGKIKFVSDNVTIRQLMKDGKPLEYARDYMLTGCHSPGIPHRSVDLPGGVFNLPMMLELALNNGRQRMTGEQIGPKTGDPRRFKSYEDVWRAYKKQVAWAIPIALMFKNTDKTLYPQYAPTPFLSSLIQGCIERGLDMADGGTAPYMSFAMALGGAPNVGDSLTAIKKVVFEDKKITMGQLVDALDSNFSGAEKILHLLEQAPKFGNDNDYVDAIVNDVLLNARDEAAKIKGYRGAVSNVAASVITSNVPLGWITGALPDGRKAGEPLSEGGISPHQGRNVCGPTATLRSVAKLDLVELTDGSVLNMKFNPDALKDDAKIRKLVSLVRTFCETGGALVQFNIVSTDTLRDAQKHPEAYRDLLVRVATYSTYFVELSKDLQDDIIARLEFTEV